MLTSIDKEGTCSGFDLELINAISKVTSLPIIASGGFGKLEDLSEFDNSYIRGEVFKFQVGTRQVIPGWETGLLGMKEGGKRTIFI